MKPVKILIPILLVVLLASGVSPVLAKGKNSIEYNVIGGIQERPDGPSGDMFLTLEGDANFGRPDLDTGWSPWALAEDQWWTSEGDRQEGPFSYGNTYPSWLDAHGIPWGFSPETTFRAEVHWWRDEHWSDNQSSRNLAWFAPKGSWSGKLVAMWGPTSAEKYSVSLNPWIVELTQVEGNFTFIEYGDWQHEQWEIFVENCPENHNQNGNHVGTWENDFPVPADPPDPSSFLYKQEILSIGFHGSIRRKGARLEGWLTLDDNKFIAMDQEHVDVRGHGQFGLYDIGFGPGDDNDNGNG